MADPAAVAGNGHATNQATQVDEATLRREQFKAAKAQRKAANATRHAAHAQEDVETFRFGAIMAQRITAAAQEAAANAMRDAAIAQRDYFVALRANMPAAPAPAPAPVPAAPQVVIQRDPLVAFVLGFLMLAILLLAAVIAQGIITGRLPFAPPPPPPPAVAIEATLAEVAGMTNGTVSIPELARSERVRIDGSHETFVSYTYDPTSRALNRPPNPTIVFTVKDGWNIRAQTLFGTRTYRSGEQGEVEAKTGAFEAIKVRP